MTIFINNSSVYKIRRDLLACLFFTVITIIIYAQVQNFDFINLDDNAYVTENRYIKNGFKLDGLSWAFTNIDAGQYIPLVWISYMVDSELCGLSPGWFHITNLFFHIINTMLLFFLLQKLSESFWRSFFVSLFFAVHPIHVESVAWVAERKDVLSMFFFLLSIIAYSNYVKKPCYKTYLLSLGLFILGLMAKPMVITLPIALLLLDYWPLGRIKKINDILKKEKIKLILEKIPYLIISFLIGILTIYGTHKSGGIISLKEISIESRLANMFVSYTTYLINLVWPSGLAVIYPYPISFAWWKVTLSVLLILSMSFFSIRNQLQRPYLLFGWFWYLIVLFPVIGLTQAGTQSMADRFAYIPFVGLYVMIVWGSMDLAIFFKIKRIFLIVPAMVVLFLLTITSFNQVKHWENSISLFNHTTHVTQKNHIAHFNLGNAFQNQDRLSEAILHYKTALHIKPYDWNIRSNLGLALLKKGDVEKAIVEFNKVISLNPDHADSLNNLGVAYYRIGENQKALFYFRRALKIDPHHIPAKSNLEKLLLTDAQRN